MFCKKCGAKIEQGQKFCSKCGNPVSLVEPSLETKEEVDKAKNSLNMKTKGCIWTIVLAFIVASFVYICSGDNDDTSISESNNIENTNSESSNESEDNQGSESSNSDARAFSTAQDVYAYLIGRTFTGDDMNIVFRQEGMYVNDVCITGAIEVDDFSGSVAEFHAVAMRSGAEMHMQVDASTGTLTDGEGNSYYSK